MNIVEMRNVAKRYGENQVLEGLDLEIRQGEVFALLGPNGAGKTTAVEILEGYRRVDSGEVSVLGHDPISGGSALRSQIGIVLQQTTSFEMSTALETVEMFAALFPNSMSADEAIELVDLGPQRHQVAATMSGGQRRRLDVACGLVGRPRLLFLDEPSTGLDPQARRDMWTIISALRDQGTTVLLTTHYLDEAEALADRIGVLIDGRLQEVAEPRRLGRRESALATVRFVDPLGTEVETKTDRPGELVTQLVARHGEPAELTVTRPSLEDIYLAMLADNGGHNTKTATEATT